MSNKKVTFSSQGKLALPSLAENHDQATLLTVSVRSIYLERTRSRLSLSTVATEEIPLLITTPRLQSGTDYGSLLDV